MCEVEELSLLTRESHSQPAQASSAGDFHAESETLAGAAPLGCFLAFHAGWRKSSLATPAGNYLFGSLTLRRWYDINIGNRVDQI